VTDRAFLIANGVGKRFPLRRGGGQVQAVRDVSFAHPRGATLGIVGESGCGKSTLARMILHLVPPSEGEVLVDGDILGRLSRGELRRKRRHMQMIFQDPQASLDSRMKVGALLAEPLVLHRIGSRKERRARVAALCELVGLAPDAPLRFPHEFSGGQRQRIAIARALALSPALIVADEPVSALDVSIQAQILNLLVELRARLGLTYVLISHDLAVIRHASDSVAVMYLGELVEFAAAEQLLEHPAHPYTRSLLAAVLEADGVPARAPVALAGEPPDPTAPPPGCAFHPRCPEARPICAATPPPERDIGPPGRPHRVRCWLYMSGYTDSMRAACPVNP
jgi:oligopeptide/dipeptide ABC transporter ATP-binding protein